MHLVCTHKEKMTFLASTRGLSCEMDAKSPVGSDRALTPKELVVAGLCGCTGMDVVALLKKYKQEVDEFRIEADVSATESGHPAVFEHIGLSFLIQGKVDAEKFKEAVKLSQTRFCGVSAMLLKAVKIEYELVLNGQKIGTGAAEF